MIQFLITLHAHFGFILYTKIIWGISVCLLFFALLKEFLNIIQLLVVCELLVLITVIGLILLSKNYGSIAGTFIATEILLLAAIKAAVGLSIIVSWIRYWGTTKWFK